MVATVKIVEITGSEASPTYTEKSTAAGSGSRYCTKDTASVSEAANYPIPIPESGTNRSYWKSHCLDITSGPSSYIKNVKYYQTWTNNPHDDWSLGTNGNLIVGVSSSSVSDCITLSQGCSQSDYDQATGTEGQTGDAIETTHSYYSSCPGKQMSITNFNSSDNALMVHSGQVVGAGETGKSRIVVTQLIVGSGATPGSKPDVTATFVYEEA